MKKFVLKLISFAAVIYGILFAVFYFDLDGKFIFYVWEPFATRHFERMKRKDNTQTPYDMKL